MPSTMYLAQLSSLRSRVSSYVSMFMKTYCTGRHGQGHPSALRWQCRLGWILRTVWRCRVMVTILNSCQPRTNPKSDLAHTGSYPATPTPGRQVPHPNRLSNESQAECSRGQCSYTARAEAHVDPGVNQSHTACLCDAA